MFPWEHRYFTETNNQAAWRALAKRLKHSNKHFNETVVKKRLVWHTISNTLNIHLPEMPEMSSHKRWPLWMFIGIAIYPEIHRNDEQAFNNMSEESENNNFIVKKSLRPVPSQGIVEQAKNMAALDPSEVTQETP